MHTESMRRMTHARNKAYAPPKRRRKKRLVWRCLECVLYCIFIAVRTIHAHRARIVLFLLLAGIAVLASM